MFELIYLITVVLFLIVSTQKKLNTYEKWMFPLVIFVLTLHLVFGISRWQLYPLYLSTLLISIQPFSKAILKKELSFRRPKLVKRVSIALVILTILAMMAFPLTSFPEVSGPYLVGTTSLIITDDTRTEIYGDLEGESRTIRLQMWYPAKETNDLEVAPWIEGGQVVTDSLASDWGFPGFIIGHTALIDSNSFLDAPLLDLESPLPVVIISHGWSGFKNLHSDLAEELASQGYLAISIDHTYGSVATLLDDEVALLDDEALPSREETPDFLEYANRLVSTYGEDVITTMNYLETLNATDGMFENKINTDQFGVIGHSTGGGGIVYAALNDDRIKGVFGLDAWVESLDETSLSEGLSVPSLFYRSEGWEISFNNEALYLLVSESEDSDLFQITGTTHYDFSMAYMYSPLTPFIGLTGDINGPDLNAILEETMLAFFNPLLKEEEISTPWLENERIERINP